MRPAGFVFGLGQEVYLCFFMGVVAQPAVGFSEVVKDMHAPLWAAGLQHYGWRRVHLGTHPAAVEDIEHHHAEQEHGAHQTDIPR